MKKISKTLRETFSAQSDAMLQHSKAKPAHDFAEITGVTGVAGHWKLPNDMTLDTLWRKLNGSGFTEDKKEFLKETIGLNPELEKVDCKDWEEHQKINDFLGGIASGFNAHDINHHLNSDPDDCNYKKDCEELKKQIGIAIQWQISPETTQMIRDHFELPTPKRFPEHFSDFLSKFRSSDLSLNMH